MRFKIPKDTEEIRWTEHVKEKMRFYGISEARIRKVLRQPQRMEKSVAPKTVGVMQKVKTKKPSEIWVMYRVIKKKKKTKLDSSEKVIIISAWRYPGISPKGELPIPEEIIQELKL